MKIFLFLFFTGATNRDAMLSQRFIEDSAGLLCLMLFSYAAYFVDVHDRTVMCLSVFLFFQVQSSFIFC